MKPKKLTKSVTDQLVKKYGSHNKAAKELGITYRRYCQLRQRQENLSRRLAIILEMRLL